MDDPLGVGGVERVRDLDGQVEDLVRGERLADDALFERPAFEELHGDEMPALVLVDVEDGADAGMVEGRGGLRFPLKSLEGARLLQQLLGQELQRDGAL